MTCNAQGNELLNEDDLFAWTDKVPSDWPPLCGPEGPASSAFPTHVANGGLGTSATVDWSFGNTQGMESGRLRDVAVEYAVTRCDLPGLPDGNSAADCLGFTDIRLSVPSINVRGIPVEDALLIIHQPSVGEAFGPRGRFRIPAGGLRAQLQFDIGPSRYTLRSRNTTAAHGVARPSANFLEVHGATFPFGGEGLRAELTVDIRGEYENRPPEAVLVPTEEPRSCTARVVFDALSSDPDRDPVNSVWMLLGEGGVEVETGSTFSAVLPRGDHSIVLFAFDGNGGSDVTALRYARRCN